MTSNERLLQETEIYISDYFAKHISPEYVFHDFEHTVQTVAAARVIGEGFQLEDHEMTLLLLATWFHDTGYTEGPKGHEERSCNNADHFLRGKIPDADLSTILELIRATKVPQQPHSLLEQIICDADLSHLGMETYWDRTGKLRQEFVLARKTVMSEQDWVDFELNFMLGHNYHTAIANELFNKRKAKHIQQLIKRKRRLNPDQAVTMEDLALLDEKDKKNNIFKILKENEKELKQARMGRGVETMYRTTYRTHTNLSTMADSKSNLMLQVNGTLIALMTSFVVPNLLKNFDLRLAIPCGILTLFILGSLIFATLATRPKVTEGKVTRESIKKRQANLLFFGNFYNMPLEDFQWGVNEMLKDSEFLYSSMSRDLYFLGKVLAKKYQYLSLCYNLFMYGIIIAVVAFAITFVLLPAG